MLTEIINKLTLRFMDDSSSTSLYISDIDSLQLLRDEIKEIAKFADQCFVDEENEYSEVAMKFNRVASDLELLIEESARPTLVK